MFDIRSKYFTTVDQNRFINEKLDLEITKKLVDKSDIAGFANKFDLNRRKSNISNKSTIKSRTGKNDKIRSVRFKFFSC